MRNEHEHRNVQTLYPTLIGWGDAVAHGQETILLVTQDEAFAQSLKKHLHENGYATAVPTNAQEALADARRLSPDLVLVDRRIGLVAQLRGDPIVRRIPFMVVQPPGLTCSEDECAADLEEGVDAVICSQGYRELIARVRAMLRRARFQTIPKTKLGVAGLSLDVDRHEVTVNGKLVELTLKEFQILKQLLLQPGRVFSRNELLDLIWGEDRALEEHTLDVHIHSLRHKIERDPVRPRFVVTVRGVGYKLRAQ